MTKELEYLLRTGLNDRYRHKHTSYKGRITRFSVQMEIILGNVWFPVVRYDTSHGFAHRDILNHRGEVIAKTPLFNQDYNSALTFAENDLRDNWPYYKNQFLKRYKS